MAKVHVLSTEEIADIIDEAAASVKGGGDFYERGVESDIRRAICAAFGTLAMEFRSYEPKD